MHTSTIQFAVRSAEPLHVLIVPDKFKGTLSAAEVCAAIARGWRSVRPQDALELLPMSDGGDGFGAVMSQLLHARPRSVRTVNAAHRPITAHWAWEPRQKLALIESARVIGLALLPANKYHPFQLDTFGLGRVLQAAASAGAERGVIGIGGSATNDAGFGLARALGWKFLPRQGGELEQWTQLGDLVRIVAPRAPYQLPLTVAVDVTNPLLGPRGCTRVYGPQKGLRPEDFAIAEKCLRRLRQVLQTQLGLDYATAPGAGAAGGLGFGLMTFAGAQARPGFELFSEAAQLDDCIRRFDLVITGEGALDRQTAMGKGVGGMAQLCQKRKIPCLALAGVVEHRAAKLFSATFALTQITTLAAAKQHPAFHLEKLSALLARSELPVAGKIARTQRAP